MTITTFRKKRRGFTLIELIASIVIIGLIVPAGAIGLTTLARSVMQYQRTSQAVNLAKDQMAFLNSLAFSSPTLEAGPAISIPDYKGSGFSVTYKITNLNPGGSENATHVLKHIMVTAQAPNDTTNVRLDTLRTKGVYFGAAPQNPTGGEADSLSVEKGGAKIWSYFFWGFFLKNTSTNQSITIDKMSVKWQPSGPNQKLHYVILNGSMVINNGFGSQVGPGDLMDINNLTLSPGKWAAYNIIRFTTPFPSGSSQTFKMTFYMQDGTKKEAAITVP